ncbi:hypothetical protein [Absidia glauca]|uniref:Uncharacterized protein n=1 Tax=Absidia glauca TaxID=4829 RepID=A0A168PQ51_ABSGL|nr:hypothetical protein [Absidia glauca]
MNPYSEFDRDIKKLPPVDEEYTSIPVPMTKREVSMPPREDTHSQYQPPPEASSSSGAPPPYPVYHPPLPLQDLPPQQPPPAVYMAAPPLPPPSPLKQRRRSRWWWWGGLVRGCICWLLILFVIGLLIGILYGVPADRCCSCLDQFDSCKANNYTFCYNQFYSCVKNDVFNYFPCDKQADHRSLVC